MRILFVDTTIHGSVGGGHFFLPGLMSGLIQKNCEVHLLVNGLPNQRILPLIEKSGCILHTDIINNKRLIDDDSRTVANWVNNLSPDVYVIQASGDIGWTILPYLNSSISTFTIGHSDAETFYNPVQHYLQFVSYAIGVSNEVCNKYVSVAGMKSEFVKWIPYGVKASLVEPEPNLKPQLNIAYVGRLEEEHKRVSDIIRIVKALRNTDIDYSLIVIGDGSLMPVMVSELSEEIISGKVSLPGWVKNEELLIHLQKSEISLLVSDLEGFCIALIEAMANGCCPIVTDIESGNKELVKDEVNGFVLSVGDIEGFVNKINYLFNNRDKLLELRKMAWQTGKNFSIDRMTNTYYSLFLEGIVAVKKKTRIPNPTFPLMKSCRSNYPLWLRRLWLSVKSM